MQGKAGIEGHAQHCRQNNPQNAAMGDQQQMTVIRIIKQGLPGSQHPIPKGQPGLAIGWCQRRQVMAKGGELGCCHSAPLLDWHTIPVTVVNFLPGRIYICLSKVQAVRHIVGKIGTALQG
jgi:hypothetical protein